MEITKEQLELGKSVLSETYDGWINRGGVSYQVGWVYSLDVDLLDDDVFGYSGVYVSSHYWEDPDDSDVQDFLECHLDDPEFRLLKFDFDGKLSEKETELFKTWIVEHYSDPETSEGVYTGTFTFDDESLVVFTSRRGGSWEGVSTDVLGVFRSFDEGVKFMFEGNGVFL